MLQRGGTAHDKYKIHDARAKSVKNPGMNGYDEKHLT